MCQNVKCAKWLLHNCLFVRAKKCFSVFHKLTLCSIAACGQDVCVYQFTVPIDWLVLSPMAKVAFKNCSLAEKGRKQLSPMKICSRGK